MNTFKVIINEESNNDKKQGLHEALNISEERSGEIADLIGKSIFTEIKDDCSIAVTMVELAKKAENVNELVYIIHGYTKTVAALKDNPMGIMMALMGGRG